MWTKIWEFSILFEQAMEIVTRRAGIAVPWLHSKSSHIKLAVKPSLEVSLFDFMIVDIHSFF